MTAPRDITIANRHPRLRLDRRKLTTAIRVLDDEFAPRAVRRAGRSPLLACPPGELSLVFLTDPDLATLHGQFLDDPTVTDVITFAGDLAMGVAGEVCVSADAAVRQVRSSAGASRKSGSARRVAPARADAFSRELTLYVVHGWLHLAGYDDLQPAKKRVMRRAEARAMKLLAQCDAMPAFGMR